MKKVIPILLVLFILLTSTCFAAYEPDPNRWMPLYATDEHKDYLDVKTLQYSADGNHADFWICRVYSNKNEYEVTNYNLDKVAKTLAFTHTTVYETSTGKVLNSFDFPSYKYKPAKITPGTIGEFYHDLLFMEIPKLIAEYQAKNPQ